MLSPFVLVSSLHGPLIISILDTGVSERVCATGTHELWMIDMVKAISEVKRAERKGPITVLDVGANFGVNVIAWSKFVRGWGQVLAFEPQERVFYALSGNIALNNLFNATALLAAAGDRSGIIQIPRPNYYRPFNLGGMSAIPEYIGEEERDRITEWAEVQLVTLDSIGLNRPDIIKIDVEGMEPEVLMGSQEILRKARPIIIAEQNKRSMPEIACHLPKYECWPLDMINVIAWHNEDPSADQIRKLVQDYRIKQLGNPQ